MASHEVTSPHPPAEQLSAFLERRLAGFERQTVIEHLVECVECRRDVTNASRLLTSARASRWSRLTYSTAAVIAAALAFVLVSRVQQGSRDQTVEERSQRVIQPDAIAPIAIVLPSDGAAVGRNTVLVWRADAPSALYKVTVLDSTGSVRWSTRTTDTSAAIPDSVRLAAGTTYYWSVDALRQDGRVTTSHAHWFTR